MWARKEVKLIFIQMFDVSDGRRKMGKEALSTKLNNHITASEWEKSSVDDEKWKPQKEK